MEEHDLKISSLIELEKWSQFKSYIQAIRKQYGQYKYEGSDLVVKNDILFRGQSNSKWELETTLERETSRCIDVLQYFVIVNQCVNEIESVTKHKWGLKTFPEIKSEIESNHDVCRLYLPCYEYLVYLRHHGFPSPLLDWTTSPYVAAFFAFCDKGDSERVAIHAYIECPQGGKFTTGNRSRISVQGPYVTTDSRHFAQNAFYTVATYWDNEKKQHIFCSHNRVFQSEDKKQDIHIKITIPRSERLIALRELSDYNINHFTLFQSEDSLIKAMSMKCFSE